MTGHTLWQHTNNLTHQTTPSTGRSTSQRTNNLTHKLIKYKRDTHVTWHTTLQHTNNLTHQTPLTEEIRIKIFRSPDSTVFPPILLGDGDSVYSRETLFEMLVTPVQTLKSWRLPEFPAKHMTKRFTAHEQLDTLENCDTISTTWHITLQTTNNVTHWRTVT